MRYVFIDAISTTVLSMRVSSTRRNEPRTRTTRSEPRNPHVAREIGEFPLVECDVIHYHLQGRNEQAGVNRPKRCAAIL